MGTGTIAAYDAHADWYNDFMPAAAGNYIARVHATIEELLGPGDGTCLDVCCGTGAHAPALAGLGWKPVGVDLSSGQLRHAVRRLPAAMTDAPALPSPAARCPPRRACWRAPTCPATPRSYARSPGCCAPEGGSCT